MTPPAFHIPVLRQEAVDALVSDPGGTYVDGTVGGGGHAEEICTRLSGPGLLIGLDADEEALAEARIRLAPAGNGVRFIHANFRDLRSVLDEAGVGIIHGLLLDLGVSSHQLDAPARGFTFREDEPLDMRLDRHTPFTAGDLVKRAKRTGAGGHSLAVRRRAARPAHCAAIDRRASGPDHRSPARCRGVGRRDGSS